jgi:hypothetical protein
MNGCHSSNEKSSPKSSVRSGLVAETILGYKYVDLLQECQGFQVYRAKSDRNSLTIRICTDAKRARIGALDFHGQFSRSLKGRRDDSPPEDKTPYSIDRFAGKQRLLLASCLHCH